MTEYLAIVDEKDNVLGKASWEEIRNKNLLHRGTGVFIFNSKKELFVHKRSKTIRRYPQQYAVAVGGGVNAEEDYEENAIRELEEETGIRGVKLHFLFKTFFKTTDIQCFIHVYSCSYHGSITLQEEEIEHGFFIPMKDVIKLMQKEKFSPPNVHIFKEYLKNHHDHDPAIKNI